ncbi:IPT/TIG domain-containing protein [Catenulispora yoronensis]
MSRMRAAVITALIAALSLVAGLVSVAQPTAASAVATAATAAPAATAPEVTYAHDDAGQLTAVFDSTGNGTKLVYDQAGNITSRQPLPSTALAVAQISPQHAHAGKAVDVYGTGFGTDLTAITVSFNGVTAKPTALHRNRLTVTVPTTATTGTVTVTVGTANTTYPALTVAPVVVPTISGLTTALADPGTPVTITGSGFDPDPSLDVVSVNGTVVGATAATTSSVTFNAPPTRSFGHVTVKTPVGTAVSTADLVTPPSPFMTADVGWVGRVKTDGTGTALALAKTQQVALALFDVPAGQRARVVVSGATFAHPYELHVWSPNETTAAHSESVSTSGSTTFDLPGGTSAGSYEVEVRPASTDTGSVTLAVTGETDANAAATVDGAAVTATTTAAGQRAVYQFTGVAGQRVFSTLTTVSATDTASAQLVSPAGQVLTTNTLLFSSANSVGYLDTTTLPMNGTYRVEVIPDNVGTGSYKMQIASVPADLSATATIGGAAVPLNFAKAGQNAKVTFTAAAGARVFTKITVSSTSNSSKCFNASLGDGAGSVFASACASSSTYLDALTLSAAGTYVLTFDPAGAVTGSLSVALLAVPADAVVASAADGTTHSTATTTGQNAVFTFAGTAGQRVFARPGITGSTTGTNLHTTLYAPDGTSLADAYNGAPIATATLPSTGTYQLVVDPYGDETGTVSATIYNVPADATATAALDGTTATATITAPGQGAVFSFTVPTSQTIYITGATTTVDSQNDGTAFSVRDPRGVRSDRRRLTTPADSPFWSRKP